MQIYYKMPLDELCARTIATARALAEEFPTTEVAVDTLEENSLQRTLDSLSRDGGVPYSDDSDIEVIAAVLDREIQQETVGWTTVFDGVFDPELGAVGDEKEVRELTERGQMIEVYARKVRELAQVRSICRAKLDAHKLVTGR